MICLQAKGNTRIKYNKNGKNFKKSDWKVVKKRKHGSQHSIQKQKIFHNSQGQKDRILSIPNQVWFLIDTDKKNISIE